jgi:phosphate-selective porin OprO/OprP
MIDNNYDFIGAVGFKPFIDSDQKALKGITFGLGGSIGNRGDVGTAATASLATYTTPGQTPLLTYNSTAATGQAVVESEDGQGWRLAPYAAYYYGPLETYAEYGLSSIEARRAVTGTGPGTGTRTSTFTNEAWQTVVSYVLTGEDASYKGVKPHNPFSPKNHTWGAWQVAARYGELRFDSAYFDHSGTATSAGAAFVSSGPQNVHDIGVGLNWYLNDNVKASLDYDYLSYSGGNAPVTPVNEDQNVFISQLQLAF